MRQQVVKKDFEKAIASVRGIFEEDCLNLAKALLEGGVLHPQIRFR